MERHFHSLEGFALLPREEPLDWENHRIAAPELRQLFQDFDLCNDPGIEEIRCRLGNFTRLEDLFEIIFCNAADFSRHLGVRTAIRLGTSAFRLSRLKFVDDLVQFLQNATDNQEDHEGRWFFPATSHDLQVFYREADSPIPLRKWNTELRKAVRHEIEQLSRQTPNQESQGTSSYAAWSAFVEQPVRDASLPPSSIGIPITHVPELSSSEGEGSHKLTRDSTDPTVGGSLTRSAAYSYNAQTKPMACHQDDSVNDAGNDEGNASEVSNNRATNDTNEKAKDFGKKFLLNLLLVVNFLSVPFTLHFGFHIGFGIFESEPLRSSNAPTPDPYPVRELTYCKFSFPAE